MTKKQQKQKDQGALMLVYLRNMFYRDGYRRILILVAIVSILNVFLAFFLYYMKVNPPQPEYFASTADGRVIINKPLSQPILSDDEVVQWARNSVQDSFAIDFIHEDMQLQRARQYFTDTGWQDFIQSLRQSNNLNTLEEKKMIMNMSLVSAPTLIAKQVVSHTFVWKIVMLMQLKLVSSNDSISMPLKITLLVARADVSRFPSRVAINNFIAETASGG